MSIQNLLSSPESKTLEFKESVPTPLSVAKTACAFDEIEVQEASIEDLAPENIELYLNKRKKARDIPKTKPDTTFLKKIK